MKLVVLLLLIIVAAAEYFPAYAQKMDSATDGLVITKLEGVLHDLDANDPSRKDLTLRLADLYSERARLEAMDETAKNCTTCTQSRDDRAKALKLYETSLAACDWGEKSRVVLQMAQLYELQGEIEKASALYRDVVNHPKEYSRELVGRSYNGLAEEDFRHIRYAKALKEFQKAFAIKETPRRDYIKYRIAWCYFHQDKNELADATLIDALGMPDAVNDSTFREEASRDLATFYSREHISKEKIDTLTSVSPENTRKDNLTYLAGELDRLGKKTDAVVVWAAIGENQKSPRDRIEGHIRMAELQFDVGRKDQCLTEYAAAIQGWKEYPCDSSESDCTVQRQRLRKLLVDWNHSDGEQPSGGLLKAYALYLSVFPDMEMNYRAAQASKKTGQYRVAITYYRNASTIAAEALKNGTTGGDAARFKSDFEAALLGEIEVAELTKDATLRAAAYQHYLDLDPSGPKTFEIKYQQARLQYEGGKYESAAESFHALALSRDQGDEALKEKSADLALDSLVLAHDDDKMVSWAAEFASAFPKRRAEYLKIAGQGTLNQVAAVLNNPAASRSDLEKSWTRLNAMKLDGTGENGKLSYYKDRLILAEKLRNLPEVNSSAGKLLSFKNLPAPDRELALSRKEWAAELTLNFGAAYALSREMKMSGLSEADRELKLGTLAELAGQNPEKEYRSFIQITKDRKQAAVIAAKLVRRSTKPAAELRRQWSVLQSAPQMLASLSLEVFAHTRDYSLAEKVVNSSSLRATPAAHTFNRFIFLKKFDAQTAKIAAHRLSRSGQAAVARSLKTRLGLMSRMEEQVAQAAQTRDWYLQVVTLDALAKQNRRLALDIMGLPLPRGLNHRERREYSQLLADQAAKYQGKAREIRAKLADIWNNYAASSSLLDDYQKARGSVRSLLAAELRILVHVAPREKRKGVIQVIATRENRPAVSVIESVKKSIRQNPFDERSLERLKGLEAQAGSETLVAYLDARISRLQTGERR